MFTGTEYVRSPEPCSTYMYVYMCMLASTCRTCGSSVRARAQGAVYGV